MGKKIRAVFNGTDEAELAAIQVGAAGVPILSRELERLYVSGESMSDYELMNSVDLPAGSYRTLFSMHDGDGSGRDMDDFISDAGGSVALTIEVEPSRLRDARRILRNNRGREIVVL